MLVIRKAQMQAFSAARDIEFADWARGHLRCMCPTQTQALNDTELRRRALVGLERARAAGFTEPQLVAEFLVLMFRYAPDFDSHPEVHQALKRELPRELLLLTLPSAVRPETWAHIQARAGDHLWNTQEH